MGRSKKPRVPGSGVSRRNFLKSTIAASAWLGARPLVAEAADYSPVPATGSGPFRHSVASGDPLSDRVMLWTRVSLAAPPLEIPVTWVVATDTALANVVQTGETTAARVNDYTVKVDVTGLSPDTTYYYRFSANGANSKIGRTKTLPVGAVDRLRIGVVSCASMAHGYFNAYRRVAGRADLDLVLHLGDYIYEYGNGEYGDLRTYEPPTEIVNLREYRTRHNHYKTDVDLQALHRQHPMIAIWDDHEFADNAWKGGAENHDPATEGTWSARVAAALRAYYEWMPIRQVATTRARNYRSFRVGDLAEIFMLEERLTARDQPLPPNVIGDTPLFTQEGDYLDPARKIISGPQQTWLVEGLQLSTAQWKLIGQGVMLAPARSAKTLSGDDVFFNPDQWDGYKPARDRLLRAFVNRGVSNAVVLTGDIHSSWAADLPLDPYGSGYNEDTGAGSLAVEFIATSVTSPGFDDVDGSTAAGLRALNPHLKYVELTRNGYLLLDITSERVSSEWWYVDTIEQRTTSQSFAKALQTAAGTNSIQPGTKSLPDPNAPPLAP